MASHSGRDGPDRHEAPRILILRLSAIGDVVMASGLLPALRSRWPNAHVTWMVEPAALPLLAPNPRLDELIVWPRSEWRQLWRERRFITLAQRVLALRRTLRDGRFDLVLDLQGLLKSALWSWLSGAPRRICLIGREGSHWLATERVIPPPQGPSKRMGNEYRHLARHLGAAEETFLPDLAIAASARDAAREALRAAGIDAHGRPYAVLCPFTTRAQKHWFEDRWAALAQRLLEAGWSPVLLGGPGDREAANRIAAGLPGLVNLVGRLQLDGSTAAISEAALLIGVDTGLTHMGSALNIPTVALFGATCPYLDPMAPRSRVLYEKLACSPCRRNPTCDGRFDCMRALDVDRVMKEALRVAALPV
ncbi:MAG: lipopolysaccharide heptosyltransferase [Burkholderiales bacterium 28-67-8]|nr:MAG: lipopolysaccharide heptosyltransferase [Burkholderiales bacterium 28-67-8]